MPPSPGDLALPPVALGVVHRHARLNGLATPRRPWLGLDVLPLDVLPWIGARLDGLGNPLVSKLATPLLRLSLVLVLLLAAPLGAQAAVQEAVFAGGCFWCLEHDLAQVSGVLEAVSGYSGGQLAQPTYQQVSAGRTGHQEAVRVRFDDSRVSYATLLRAYWRNVDALDGGGQFCDRGNSYRPVIFTAGDDQASQARRSLQQAAQELKRSPAEIKVRLQALKRFWPAEAYHQNYAETHKVAYNYYRWACGRDQRLDQLWGKRARSNQAWAG